MSEYEDAWCQFLSKVIIVVALIFCVFILAVKIVTGDELEDGNESGELQRNEL